MFAMAEEMEQNTIGTTTQNIMFMNTVPSGSRAVAPGHTAPTMQSATMPDEHGDYEPIAFEEGF